ncbi:hypothetical protein MYCTH_2298290 [Thermothelomyces thermophilus ATCC 42464]|uniref:GAT domain-containing protein n=1 Tax=Thermothelomyces thermophilus (strain ATCC 42464 / BCRC 31852 / DSM 1799) TaxID=573729 RepID=G2Q1K2_THET4|nr:uncharacterized protein MYCTH_2298290 [Thermothelomyces thermophilus ATCC 42464]AEO54993.1 hypothetical protein MYCTH_2298290 [Thermothelomyces thermophilus ATCC 42464]
MAGFSMNKVLGTIKKRPTLGRGGSVDETSVDPAHDTPEAIATRCVKQFCQSVGSASGDDVIFLPSIVEAAVASPAAAAESARLIRKFLQRDYWSKPSFQYNAIMLLRILADNPGPGFTRFLDKKFVDVTKELLRSGRDPSVRQILMETLDAFETTKSLDEGLALIIGMWQKEKEKAYKAYGGVPAAPYPNTGAPYPTAVAPGYHQYQQPQPQAHYPRPNHGKRLPEPAELANRLEEARTSAKLLEQFVACTPPSEILSNDLVKEFADRCGSASRSIQGYMSAEDPAPDNDTMESLIDTNEQLQQALNHHRRAVLQAKKQLGNGGSSNTSSPAPQEPHSTAPPPVPSRSAVAGEGIGRSGSGISSNSISSGNGKGKAVSDPFNHSSAVAGLSRSASRTPRRDHDDHDDGQDPFRDPPSEDQHYADASSSSRRLGAGAGASASDRGPPPLSFESSHPGFGGSSGGSGGGSSSAAAATADAGHAYRY